MAAIRCSPAVLEFRDYDVQVSKETIDPAWDAFLAAAGGEYPQTSMWALAKSGSGYGTRRITVKHEGAIIGGVQLLIRPLPLAGAMAYAPLGPVLIAETSSVARFVVDHIQQIIKKERLRLVAVQAPAGSPVVADALRDGHFSLWSPKLAPTASVLIDLSDDIDFIFSQMSATTRKHIRRTERSDVRVREGAGTELIAFQRLACATASRRGFAVPSEQYLLQVWRAFAPTGNIKLFLAEKAGEPLAALIVFAFGKTATCWRMGWAGKQSGVYPNETMHWTAMQWAKSQGYRSFDLGGIHLDLARSILAGKTRDINLNYKVDYFKLGFGGKVTLFPEPFSCVPNPLLRGAWPLLSGAMTRFGHLRRLMLNRFTSRS